MDTRISPGGARMDVIPTDTATRVTPQSGPAFREMLSRGAGALLRGAEAAVSSLPGAPIVAAAVRPGASVSGPALSTPGGLTHGPGGAISLGTAEGPAGAGLPGSPGTAPGQEAGSVEQALSQSQEFNLYYLQLQEQLAAENRSYSAMSNVLKARHDTVKNAIGNIR
jgi:hypothetical protein